MFLIDEVNDPLDILRHCPMNFNGGGVVLVRPKVLVVEPGRTGGDNDGDNVVHRQCSRRLALVCDVRSISLQRNDGWKRLFNLAADGPPELARHRTRANAAIVSEAAYAFRPDVICLFNETTFPVLSAAKKTGARIVLYPHNVHSQIMASDTGLASWLFRRKTRRFEEQVYGDKDVGLVCISRSDARSLTERGIRRDAAIAPPGAPPPEPLADGAPMEPVLALTGSFGWWRKRRDLARFAEDRSATALPCYVSDAIAAEFAIEGARPAADLDWTSAIRVGLIADRFTGGFKLKSTEYVARNCAIASFADIEEEYAGLVHAETFVRTVASRAEAEAFAQALAADPATPEHFRAFKDACLARFDWAETLTPLVDEVMAAAKKSRA